ncbi:MAG: hypothetical protein K8F52_08800 [Candidatus Scalindua rubra]|uniref:RAMP superfamily protein n=1 Tax=Candidatus Scalindua brodae TaxID=237368 RepID=A0A0B0EKD7_9BACT|nr:MAG: RAMP superfamily protein [Candidatus Scalindua brodae]MBZ0108757.1 hypothetical protein [Candidatus Scalindua rubra]TWU30946.1 RAMP superfamily protein [Candidatus Brocadiaceae bacterium S225]
MNEYIIRFHLMSNLHIGSGFSFMGLVDKTTIKNEKNMVVIPGSTIKGKLRSACKKICRSLESEFGHVCDGKDSPGICKKPLDEVCIICRLFGSSYTEGKLLFREATLSLNEQKRAEMLLELYPFASVQSELRSGNRISRSLRTSYPKQLFVSESCPGELTLEGKICSKEALTETEKRLLSWGAKSILQIGGQKGRGLGRVSIAIEGI